MSKIDPTFDKFKKPFLYYSSWKKGPKPMTIPVYFGDETKPVIYKRDIYIPCLPKTKT